MAIENNSNVRQKLKVLIGYFPDEDEIERIFKTFEIMESVYLIKKSIKVIKNTIDAMTNFYCISKNDNEFQNDNRKQVQNTMIDKHNSENNENSLKRQPAFASKPYLSPDCDCVSNSKAAPSPEIEECAYLLEALWQNCWEHLNIGRYISVPYHIRQTFTMAALLKVFFLLMKCSHINQIDKCAKILDEAILMGCHKDLFKQSQHLFNELLQLFNEQLSVFNNFELPIIEIPKRCEVLCDIKQLHRPSVEQFRIECYEKLKPALLINTLLHWPALQLWPDLNYILKTAGNRLVPVEIGANYASENWSQHMIKMHDFLKRQFPMESSGHQTVPIEYLAQHDIFDQIPQLRKDIFIPDYCAVGLEDINQVNIKAWLGPKGTVSPLHHDPKHNFLCQVFGQKSVILAAPDETPNLYPYQTELLNNTSQVNAACVDSERFPLAKKVQFYHLTLQPGDCLYIPSKWWHYIRSESPSFSVSFWWQ